jgi:hypothetical protein
MSSRPYKTFLILFVFLFTKSPVFAQKKILKSKFVQSLISKDKDSTKTASIIALPVLAYSQETGLEYGLLGSYIFVADQSDSIIRSSNIELVTSLTSKKQSNVNFSLNFWSPENKYHYISQIRYRNFPFSFYGIGDQTLAEDKKLLTQKLFRINLEAEKLLSKNYYAGINLKFENFVYTTYKDEAYNLNTLYGGSGGKLLALGVSQLYDSRNSSNNTQTGFYARLKYAYAPNLWGNQNYNGSSLLLDFRKFIPLNNKSTLGLQSIYQATMGEKVPFYLLPQLGNDEMMRGYYQGRFRDKKLFALQSELRFRVHERIGIAFFGSAGTVYPKNIDLSRLKLSYGSGIHYFFNLEHEASIRMDYAVGEKMKGEQRQSGFYLSLGQAF